MTRSHPPTRPCSFAEAVDTYNNIKPSRGKYAAYDVRPLGRRSNQHERIIKIDENNYALWPSTHWWNKADNFDKEDARIRAAVLWQRTAEGDFVHVRNSWYSNGMISHYRFLNEVLPHGLAFATANGKQYIIPNFALKKNYLPHDMWFGGSYEKHITRQGNPNKPTAPDTTPITPELVYKHEGGRKFTLVSKEYDAPKKLVNLELKKALTPSIKAFKEWAMVMAPMLNLKPYWMWNAKGEDPTYTRAREAHAAQNTTDARLLKDWMESNGYGRIYVMDHVAPKIVRQIVETEDHPMRVVLAKYILDYCGYMRIADEISKGEYYEHEGRAKLGTAFNYHMNRVLGLVEKK
jgi:hypothetical protein